MRVAIIHYHLDPGGVAQVIQASSRALTAGAIAHIILTGESDATSPPVIEVTGKGIHRQLPGLNYLDTAGNLTGEQLTDTLRAAAGEALGGPPEIWHFHNHSLGKNRLIPDVINLLATAGERLVLQIHDLAEQGRPTNYQLIADPRTLYPFAPRIHYAFLNSRDLKHFIDAGLPPANASVLPNPLTPSPTPPAASESPILFAPVRGIRRKNLGELVLLAALAPAGTRLAVSRAPRNPEALTVHDTWRKFSSSHRLPIEFNVVDRFAPAPGAPTGFDSWLAHASHIVTTSVSEGFGLPFLEAIALDKPLIGRNLPHLTADHARYGILAGRLYEQILIPGDWLDITILRDHLTTVLERNYRAYRRPLTKEIIAATLAALVHKGLLDFGNLPEPLQQGVIERLGDPRNRRVPLVQIGGKTQVLEDWLVAALAERTPTASPAQLAPYSPDRYWENLIGIYSQLANQPTAPVHYLNADAILTAHLTPTSFHFLLSALAPRPAPVGNFRAVIFDLYGTLLDAPPGGVKPDPEVDPALREVLESFGHIPPESPSTELHAAVLRHHAASGVPFPEIDLRVLWREILSVEPGVDLAPLVAALEARWHPATLMPGADTYIQGLARSGISLGLLSNAQCHSLADLGGLADLFAPELTLLSYQHGIAKPTPELFQMLADRLAGRGITPAETLYIGNDPLHDILPAAAIGFRTALFTGHADSSLANECAPDFLIPNWHFPPPQR